MTFKIYIDRLKERKIEEIEEIIDPSVLSLAEEDLFFHGPVTFKGRAYLASQHLILDLSILANAQMPCSICNEIRPFTIKIEDFSHTENTDNIKSAIYDFSEELRSAILLRIPQFFECFEGNCPQRKTVNQYLKFSSDETYTPFADLDP